SQTTRKVCLPSESVTTLTASLTQIVRPSFRTLRNSQLPTPSGSAASEESCRLTAALSDLWTTSNTDRPASSSGAYPNCAAPNWFTDRTVPSSATVKYIDGLSWYSSR